MTDLLAAHGVDTFLIPDPVGTVGRLGVRGSSWNVMLSALAEFAPAWLFGEEHRYSRPGTEVGPIIVRDQVPSFAASNRIHVIDPVVTVVGGRVVAALGLAAAVTVECWSEDGGGRAIAPVWNPYAEDVDLGTPATFNSRYGDFATLPELAAPNIFDISFPIDVVYTWVDGSDPAWVVRKRAAVEQLSGESMTEDAAADLRFVDHDELRYSLRSIEQYAPWVRHIYIVTDRQRPAWLKADHPRITVVDHTDIAPPGASLPTFNSHAIEANLHRIEGLSEHFLYFNDDVFLSSPVGPDLFFSANGIAHMYLSKAQVSSGEPVPGEPASDSAGKNARRMVMEVSGRRLSRKLFHTPFALQRSVTEEIEARWPADVAGTRSARFRRISDVTLAGALHMNYAYAVGRAVTRGIRYRYVNVGAEDAETRLARLYKDRHVLQTFCLNEATQEQDPAAIDQLVRRFLERRFPDVSTFELIDDE
ncbi:stealth family protein [Pseudactinotalea sp. HY158]|uniref:stealth family protein n=1 Tax=Pseudactinotalea sp. HY158 TaxID=2654547 RepID=UPI00129C7A3D|nr:stealth family protein [Pseudactinotalea sp. HY158]QGH70075.1 sugar phosphotransferase [Pseudactinotalea sp. HY158]